MPTNTKVPWCIQKAGNRGIFGKGCVKVPKNCQRSVLATPLLWLSPVFCLGNDPGLNSVLSK